MVLIASSCFDCLSAGPVKRIGLYPKSRRRRAIEAADVALTSCSDRRCWRRIMLPLRRPSGPPDPGAPPGMDSAHSYVPRQAQVAPQPVLSTSSLEIVDTMIVQR
jgi:hypothetical protein